MKMYELVAFSDFYGTINNNQCNMTVAYKINKIIQAITPDLEFYQTELQKICNDCFEIENNQYKTNENGDPIVKSNKIEEFNKRYTELRNIDVDFDNTLKLDISLFDGIQVSPQEILNITNFLK